MTRAPSGESTVTRLLAAVADAARRTGLFAEVSVAPSLVSCTALAQPEAAFRLEVEGNTLAITWVSPNRYLSQSIEADLMWTGDSLDELIDEELAETGYTGAPLGRVEHYRNPDKLFTFRSKFPGPIEQADPDTLVKCLVAYNTAFAHLGDMKGDDEDSNDS